MSTGFRKDISLTAYGSLLLGVLTFMIIPFFYITVFPALILAHISLRKAQKSDEPVEGKSIAILGLVVNYGFLVAMIILPILCTYFDDMDQRPLVKRISWVTNGFSPKPDTRRNLCKTSLMQLGVALTQYSATNDGTFPPSLNTLLNNESFDENHLHCSGKRFYSPLSGKHVEIDFIYTGNDLKVAPEDSSRIILAYDEPGNHRHEWTNILFADGHVKGFPESSIYKIVKTYAYDLPRPKTR